MFTATSGEAIKAALSNLWALRQRSVLALLGIIIGTASVVAMLTIGRIAEAEALRLFNRMGVDVLLATTSGGDLGAGLNVQDIDSLPNRLSLVSEATPVATGHVIVPSPDGDQSLNTVAARAALPSLAGLEIAKGRFLADVDADNFVAVLGADVPGLLSRLSSSAGAGAYVRVGDYLFRVIGVLKRREPTTFDPTDFNRAVIIPIDLRSRAPDRPAINAALVRARAGTDPTSAVERLQAVLKTSGPGVQLQVRSARQLIATIQAQKAVHTRLLAAIGAISLVVGGIGVMNVMLMGVMERRSEIGLRAAVGATPADIQLMFLVEAAVLALFGGLVGAALGVAAAAIVAKVSGWVFVMAWSAVPLGAGMAGIVGLGFGLYPAVKASRLDPIEALRAE